MISLLFRYFIISVAFLISINTFGQLTANFTANKTDGCGVLGGVVFTDQSTGNPTDWLWDFGNGNTSVLQNPTANFSNPGSYSIKLTVSLGGTSNSVIKTNYITVYRNPESKFSAAPASGCVPLTVNFTDNSTSADGIINQWLWDFNDGSPSSGLKKPAHTYTNVASYNVSLKVTDNNGCSNTKIENGFVQPNPRPSARISTLNSRSSCTAPYTVNFISNSLGQNLQYLWTFGDGGSSTQANPSHTYNALGVYNVSLRVIDQSGCSDSITRVGYITVKAVEAKFDFVADSICKGDSIQLLNNSVNATNFQWSFGDGRTSTSSLPTVVFNNAGTYQIKLRASRGSACVDEITKTFYVDSVKAAFNISPIFSCEDSTYVTFTNQSYGSDSTHWILGNRIYKNANSITFFDRNGIFADTLIAVSKIGCIDTVARADRTVSITEINITSNSFGGCIPHRNFITANVKSASPILSYFWEFGDNGSFGTSTNRDTVSYLHTVDTAFNLYVTILDSNGCEAHDTLNIGAGTPPSYSFEQLEDTICASDSLRAVIIFDKPQMGIFDLEDKVLGDVLKARLLGDTLVIFNFLRTGLTEIDLTFTYNGCIKDTSIEVYVNGPIIYTIRDSINCLDKKTHYFSAITRDFDRFYWDFGDGSAIDSTSITPTHTYPSKDTSYSVTLTLFNDSSGCSFISEITTRIDKTVPKINTTRTNTCVPFNYTLFPALPSDVDNFFWIFGNDTLTGDSLNLKMDSAGTHFVQIIAESEYGCIYSPSINIVGYDFKASFIADTTSFCDPSRVIFTSITTSNTFITSNVWNFGNGDTSIQNIDTTNYNIEGYYDVTLTTADLNGCISTTTKNSYIRFFRNIPRFSSNNRTACVGEIIPFVNNSIGDSLTFLWDLGNGQTSTSTNASTIYTAPGTYDVSLKSNNPLGCEEVWVLPNYITVEAAPVADFTSDTSVSSCYPLPVNFTNTSTPMNEIVFNRWNFGDNTPISQFQDAFHNYTSVGNYDVTLIVGTNAGCKDTISKVAYIQTNGPQASINFYPDSICINESITFESINPSSVSDFIWDFGDGASSKESPVSHRYTDKAGPTIITLILSDTTGECVIGIKDTVYIKEMIALIGVTDTSGCEPLVVDFIDNSQNTSKSIWKLFDGTTSNQSTFSKTFSAGNYPVQLITEGLGCFDTTLVNLQVFAKPTIEISSDTVLCEGDSVQLFGNGAQFYNWVPSSGLNNPTTANPIASPNKSTAYQLTITDTNNCQSVDSLSLTVYNKPVIELEPDSLIYLGEEITIVKENNRANVTYTWKPPTGLNCTDCTNPVAKPLKSTWYYLTTNDKEGCFNFTDSIYIEVIDGFSAELPTAFTPNGDGNNDLIYLKGWGIKELLIYQIYNRWGELVFETNDLKTGWDGNYKNQPQAMDTYIYIIKALGYNDQIIEKKGNITLLR